MSVPVAEGLNHYLRQAVPESTKLGLKRSGVRARVKGLKANIYYTIGMCKKQSDLPEDFCDGVILPVVLQRMVYLRYRYLHRVT